jgi:hypothetical protein
MAIFTAGGKTLPRDDLIRQLLKVARCSAADRCSSRQDCVILAKMPPVDGLTTCG